MGSGEQLCDPRLHFSLYVVYIARPPPKIHEPRLTISQSRLTFGQIQMQASTARAEIHAGTPGASPGLKRTQFFSDSKCDGRSDAVEVGPPCRVGVNLFQIDSKAVGGQYAAPLLLGISKRSLLEGTASTPAYAAYSGWHADSMFSLVPAKTQVKSWSFLSLWMRRPLLGCLVLSTTCHHPLGCSRELLPICGQYAEGVRPQPAVLSAELHSCPAALQTRPCRHAEA